VYAEAASLVCCVRRQSTCCRPLYDGLLVDRVCEAEIGGSALLVRSVRTG
jgi:hypothetical protein